MGSSARARLGRVLLAAVLGLTILPLDGLGPSAATAAAANGVPTLPEPVVAYALQAPGATVRTATGLTVVSVTLDQDLRARFPRVGDTVYRVTLAGRYPPRALRYVVRAGSRAVGYGVPGARERALRTVTTDAAVLTATISARYGDRPRTGLPAATSPAPAGTGRLGPATGPHDVSVTAYDLGDQVYQPAGLGGRVELVADVHYPTDLNHGPYPIVLFLHGNHSSCYRGTRARYEWPCPDGWQPIPNYEGYDYLASRLASYGFVVVSVSGNGVNVLGNWVSDTGMKQRGLLLEKHLDLWNTWNTTGGTPFGTTFVGAVDMSRIGVMGHSRGGEGAVWQVVVDRNRAQPYGIDAVLPLAPVDFTRVVVNDVPMGVILPYCDGDVYDLQGVHFFDDARYAMPGDPTPKATVTVFGANHNFFNTVWSPSSGIPGSFDDGWDCAGRLTEQEQRRVGIAYVVSFFRRYVGDKALPGRVWTGEVTPPIAPARTIVTYLAPDTPATRLDVDRFDTPGSLGVDQLGGAVTATDLGIAGWCSNLYETPCVPGDYSWMDIHLSYSWFGTPPPGLQEGVLGWPSTAEGQASIAFDLAGARDITPYDFLVFRAVPNPTYPVNQGIQYQDLSVVLTDANGATASVAAADVGNDPLAWPFEGRRRRVQGHIIMNQLRFPLSAFTGVDLSAVTTVTLAFDRTDAGVIDVSDLAFMHGEG
jgi:acetyl esterase/lipase